MTGSALLVDLGPVAASVPDLLRLVVLPAFGWAAWRDLQTRRVSGRLWRPLVVLGVALLVVDAWRLYGTGAEWTEFAVEAGLAVGFVVPLAYLFWRIGGFGGADVKAVMIVAVLVPTYPEYLLSPDAVAAGLPGLVPPVDPPIAVFALTVLTNAVLLGAVYPVGVTLRNALAGRVAPVMFVGRPVPVEDLPETYGRLLERPGGTTRRGLDLDALRMYLRWRGTTLSELRAAPERHRDPDSLPESPNDPTDGNVRSRTDGAEEGTDHSGPGGDRPADRGGDPDPASGTTDPAAPEDRSPDAGVGGGSGASPDDAETETEADAGSESGDDEGGDPEEYDDPWGAEAFLTDIEGTAYGTSDDQLRAGLEVLADPDREDVWVSPGLPFILPLFLGLLAGFTVGDVLFWVLGAVGVA